MRRTRMRLAEIVQGAVLILASFLLFCSSTTVHVQASFITPAHSRPTRRRWPSLDTVAAKQQAPFNSKFLFQRHSQRVTKRPNQKKSSQNAAALHATGMMDQDAITNTAIFIAGIIPFAWATFEFWNRIAVGEPFGTGKDSVYIMIGKDNEPQKSRGQRVLDKGAFVVAYILFAIAAGAIGVSLFSVVTSPGNVPPISSS